MCELAALGDPGEPHGIPERTLQDRLVEMVAAVLPGTLVDLDPSRREDPLPGPLAAGVRVLARQGPRELHPAGAVCQVEHVLPLNISRCSASASFTAAGNMVTRSLSPLPARSVIWFLEKSTSGREGGRTPASAGPRRSAGSP